MHVIEFIVDELIGLVLEEIVGEGDMLGSGRVDSGPVRVSPGGIATEVPDGIVIAAGSVIRVGSAETAG